MVEVKPDCEVANKSGGEEFLKRCTYLHHMLDEFAQE